MFRRFPRWASYLLCLFSLLWTGCPTPPQTNDPNLGFLKTNVEGNLVVFSDAKVGESQTQKILLYNDSSIPVLIEGVKLVGETPNAFSFQPKLAGTTYLPPGKTTGLSFEIAFSPQNAGTYRASLSFVSPNVSNVDDSGQFRVHLFAQVAEPPKSTIRFACGGSLDFGTVSGISEKSCELHNDSDQTVKLDNIQYQPQQGNNTDFRWLRPSLPMNLAPKEHVSIVIQFTPDKGTSSQGEFWLLLNPPPALGAPRLKVKGQSAP